MHSEASEEALPESVRGQLEELLEEREGAGGGGDGGAGEGGSAGGRGNAPHARGGAGAGGGAGGGGGCETRGGLSGRRVRSIGSWGSLGYCIGEQAESLRGITSKRALVSILGHIQGMPHPLFGATDVCHIHIRY